MLKRREHYRDSATDDEALSVQRNAPRWIKAFTKFVFPSRRTQPDLKRPASLWSSPARDGFAFRADSFTLKY